MSERFSDEVLQRVWMAARAAHDDELCMGGDPDEGAGRLMVIAAMRAVLEGHLAEQETDRVHALQRDMLRAHTLGDDFNSAEQYAAHIKVIKVPLCQLPKEHEGPCVYPDKKDDDDE